LVFFNLFVRTLVKQKNKSQDSLIS